MYSLIRRFSLSSILLCFLVVSCNAFQCNEPPHKRAALEGVRKWPDNTIPYEIDTVYTPTEQKLIVDSLTEFSDKTSNCVRFVPRTEKHSVYVRVESRDGCWSYVGMTETSGAQIISLDRSGCMTKTTVMHEFNHALGFIHEQKRPDRDNYVKILFENVQPDNKHNFDKDPNGGLQSFGLPYDFNSIMHYVYNGFSTNGLPTMVTASEETKAWRYKMGTGNKLSDDDIFKVKKVYDCI